MTAIKDLQEQLLSRTEPALSLHNQLQNSAATILVLKNYRFHKQLSLELYNAPTTQTGKLKNPLLPVAPLDAAVQTKQPEALRFYAAVGHFQNHPTAPKSPLDLERLKIVLANPLQLRLFYHDPGFSENVVAGSLHKVFSGAPITDAALLVHRKNDCYEISAQLTLEGKTCSLHEVELKYDYFVLAGQRLHLLGRFPLVQVFRFFRQLPSGLLRIPEGSFAEFQRTVLAKLEDDLQVVYNCIRPGTKAQLEETGIQQSLQMLLYLSDQESYVLINPVLKYGTIEIPVRTKRQIYTQDAEGRLFAAERNEEAETSFTALLLQQHADFEEQLQNDLPYFYLHKQRFLDENWFLDAFEQWQAAGIAVLGFNQLKGNRLNGHKAKVTIQVTSGLNWFNTLVDVRFGKKKASLKQLHQSVLNKNRFVLLDDGTLGILPEQWLEKFAAYFKIAEIAGEVLHTPKINFFDIKKQYKGEELDKEVKAEINRYEARLAQPQNCTEADVPVELNASLRGYQKQGLNWLNTMDAYNFGGCLADDMGLGKTVQVIAFILGQRKKVAQNTNLVVVPTSLIFNWQAEVQKFAPSIKVHVLYGGNRIKKMRDLDRYEIVLTSYGTLLSDIAFLKHYMFNYIFLDESQNIKNIESQRYHAARQLQSRNKIAITGTPVENNTLDLYAQLSFACPGLLGSKRSFKDLFAIPIDKFKSSRHAAELQRKVAPFILRRTKKEVASELPEKTEVTLYCPMGEAQRKLYDAYEQEFRDFISGITEEELPKRTVHVLKGLTRLRQICDSPLLLGDEKLYGDQSSKMELLLEQIQNNAPNHKVLVFSQFVSMLDLIKKECDNRGIPYEYLTGRTKDRQQVVNNFQTNEAIRVFLISLKAGGTGLNLTEADYVYLVDPWWNPAVENQAIDRSYRIGQKKNVVAVRLICPGTLEEKMMKLQETKRALSDDLVKTETSFLNLMSKEDWLELLNP